ncbi:MAG: hypothetical protein ACYDD0_08860 [Candidatus Dormibacteria bacterium]
MDLTPLPVGLGFAAHLMADGQLPQEPITFDDVDGVSRADQLAFGRSLRCGLMYQYSLLQE